jgi:hypothetical protein
MQRCLRDAHELSAPSLVISSIQHYRRRTRVLRRLHMRCVLAIASLVIVAALTSCTSTSRNDAPGARSETSSRPRPTTDDYRRYIRGNVPAFNSSGVTDWDAPDPQHVVVWTSPAEAYLLTLFGACFGLKSASTILLSADGGVVRPGAAAVMVGPERCRIQFVEKLDARQMKADKLR